jgi:hypothetical protein
VCGHAQVLGFCKRASSLLDYLTSLQEGLVCVISTVDYLDTWKTEVVLILNILDFLPVVATSQNSKCKLSGIAFKLDVL